MDKRLEDIAQSYDRAIELGSKGIDQYSDLPREITDDPRYQALRTTDGDVGIGDATSARAEIRDYLAPEAGMRFIDLGCCLNLMFRGYDKWPSTYYGVDISPKTIALLNHHVAVNKLTVGALQCASIHQLPFDDGFFDIGACIGVLEYFQRDFVAQAVAEACRVLKPGARLVLDIPNIDDPMHGIVMKMEAYIGRPDLFDMTTAEFEALLDGRFSIHHKDVLGLGAMTQYFLCRLP